MRTQFHISSMNMYVPQYPVWHAVAESIAIY